MAKDPAFLFYPGDWQGGTTTFTRFLKGCYMDVLIAQFNSGHLSLEEIKTVLGSDFGQSWPTIQKKFKKDNDGLFFNEKLETEMIKRREYSKSRAENRKKKDMNNISNTHDKTYVSHMENGNENINDIDNKNKKESIENVSRATVDTLSDESLDQIFHEQFMQILRMNYKLIDVDDQLQKFKLKVRGSPDDYKHRDVGGIRLAFQYQLRQAKPEKKNGTTTNKSTEHVNSLVEGFKRRHGGAASG